MPPLPLMDLARVDLNKVILTRGQIYECLPHQFEFQVLDGVCHIDHEDKTIVAYSDIKTDAWWCRGHIPGRPLLPGVLMLEMAAQTSAVLWKLATGVTSFLGFGGVEDCKFRDAVVPPARLYLISKNIEARAKRSTSATQGVVGDRLVFEATITGLPMR